MKDKKLTSKLNIMYIIALIPLIAFGLYKNGYDLYRKNYVEILGAFKPLIIISMSFIGTLLGIVIKEFKMKKHIDFSTISRSGNILVESIILGMMLPIKSSPIIIFVISLIFNLLLDKFKLNRIAVIYIIIYIINMIFKLNVFENAYQLTNSLNYDGFDLFLGYSIGGICSTSSLLILISLIFLSFNKLYKRDLSISAVVTFLLLGIVPNMISGEYSSIFKMIFGYNILFSLVFVAPNLYYSAYTIKGQILSGILIGVITYFITLITPYNASLIAILIVNLLNKIIDRIFVIK